MDAEGNPSTADVMKAQYVASAYLEEIDRKLGEVLSKSRGQSPANYSGFLVAITVLLALIYFKLN